MNPVEPGKPSRRRDLMNQVVPDNEFTQWRLWSPVVRRRGHDRGGGGHQSLCCRGD